MGEPRQMPELGVAVEVPALGGDTQGRIVYSNAPISGVVALRATLLTSVVIPTNSPLSSTAEMVGVRSPPTASTYSGSMLSELASWLVAACQSANVTWLLPLFPIK